MTGPISATHQRENCPIVMIQWGNVNAGDDSEPDEIADALEILRKEWYGDNVDRMNAGAPLVSRSHVTDADPVAFLTSLNAALALNPMASVLYISAHGLDRGLQLRADRSSFIDEQLMVKYGELAEALARHNQRGLSLVMGSCKAMSSVTNLLPLLPACIVKVVGFTGEPRASQVAALIAGVIRDGAALFQLISRENQQIFGKGIPWNQRNKANAELERRWTYLLETFREHPDEYIRDAGGAKAGFLMMAQRDPQTQQWEKSQVTGLDANDGAGIRRGDTAGG